MNDREAEADRPSALCTVALIVNVRPTTSGLVGLMKIGFEPGTVMVSVPPKKPGSDHEPDTAFADWMSQVIEVFNAI